MALFDFLKKKESAEKAKNPSAGGKKPVKKPVKASVAKKEISQPEEKKVEPKAEPVKHNLKASKDFSYNVVKEPHISEKATILGAEENQYVFKIFPGKNKIEVKKAVEAIYGVNVLSVNMINIPAKKRRMGKTQGFKKGYAKAIVKIKEGEKIEIL